MHYYLQLLCITKLSKVNLNTYSQIFSPHIFSTTEKKNNQNSHHQLPSSIIMYDKFHLSYNVN